MSDRIKLVSGDNRPYITLTLTDADGTAINLSGSTVRIFFRAAGTTTILSTLLCSYVTTGTDGKVIFNFPGTTLDVPAGYYEGEIQITYAGSDIQTVYDVLKFQIREQFD